MPIHATTALKYTTQIKLLMLTEMVSGMSAITARMITIRTNLIPTRIITPMHAITARKSTIQIKSTRTKMASAMFVITARTITTHVVYLIAYIFSGGPAPDPLEAGDADCTGDVDIDDVVYVIQFIFAGGPEPCAGCP
jgi:hypothetical protein